MFHRNLRFWQERLEIGTRKASIPRTWRRSWFVTLLHWRRMSASVSSRTVLQLPSSLILPAWNWSQARVRYDNLSTIYWMKCIQGELFQCRRRSLLSATASIFIRNQRKTDVDDYRPRYFLVINVKFTDVCTSGMVVYENGHTTMANECNCLNVCWMHCAKPSFESFSNQTLNFIVVKLIRDVNSDDWNNQNENQCFERRLRGLTRISSPFCWQDLALWAYPKTPGFFEDAVVCCIRENPEPVVFKISCHGVRPELELDRRQLQFDRVLLHRFVR